MTTGELRLIQLTTPLLGSERLDVSKFGRTLKFITQGSCLEVLLSCQGKIFFQSVRHSELVPQAVEALALQHEYVSQKVNQASSL